MKTRAFTLLELLVVVAVIAVFVTVIGAALGAGRTKSDTAKCIGNLRLLVSANLTYAADHGGQFCPAQEPSNLVRWHGVRQSVLSEFDATKGPLSPYLGEDRRTKLCPALGRVLEGIKSFESGTGGYGYNAAYIGGTPLDPFTPARLASLQSPSKVVMFADTAFPRMNGLQEYAYAEPWQWMDYKGRLRGKLDPSVHFRHSGCANVGWCDGHVSTEAHTQLGGMNRYRGDSKYWKVGWFGPSEENGFWRP
ncbi:MAG TPA: prepilin-type N-terminal cleavage/methylation domain-containing protein [Chthoniobacteraceae bacterium]|nr:prepilin-type N-terminal cleavage/methylation domain-containing protein [Chthoniobacteraceae bacterium]